MSIFIGHQNAETPLHTDSFFVSVWIAIIKGAKTARLVEPVDYKKIYNGLDIFDDSNVKKLDGLGINIYEANCEEGDVLFIPPGFWHQVKNHGFNIALSTNFLIPHNFLVFEQQLKSKLLKPYFNLLKIKRELISDPANKSMRKSTSLKHANFVLNESKFIDFFSAELEKDNDFLNKVIDELV